jgi:4-amino-4-deoxy-L-arabinose transferase-like glycosyltransferase
MSVGARRLLERDVVWLPALLLASFFIGLGWSPLFDLDEGAFGAATWEMLQRGDYITTYLNGEPRFDKPILIYWLQALSVSVFGVREWAFRLPSALAASLWVLSVYRFTAQFTDRAGARLAAAVTATALTVVVIGRAATADALLNLFLALAMLDAYRYAAQPRRAPVLRVYAWMALGMLTKGPVAVVIPVAVSLLYFLTLRRWTDWWRAILEPRGWIVFLAIALPWYVLEYHDQGQAFIDGFFLKHNVGRFTETMEGHGGNPLYYVLFLWPVLMPYAGPVLALIPKVGRLWHDPFDRWMLLWFAVVFVVFSLSSTQLPHYILYGCTPLFILIARYRHTLSSRALAFLPPLLLFAVFLALPYLTVWIDVSGDSYLESVLIRARDEFGLAYRLAAAFGIAAVLTVWSFRKLPIMRALVGIGVVQALFLALFFLPSLGGTLQVPVKEAATVARGYDEPVVMWRINMPSFTVYREQVTPRRAPREGELVFTRVDKLERLGHHERLYDAGGIILARKLSDVQQ